MNISIIGSGNVATHLGKAIHRAGFNILDVYSRDLINAKALASELQARAVDAISALGAADLYIIAVKDEAIVSIAKQLNAGDGIVVHTSGTIGLDALNTCSNNPGVFYPLQTFSKNKQIDMYAVPICLEASNASTMKILIRVGKAISKNVQELNSQQRMHLHIAAVIACNFSNHLYVLAAELLEKEGMLFELLKPLILETANKIQSISPVDAQTGPASREDKVIIEKHLEALKSNPQIAELYRLLSASIAERRMLD